MNEHHKQTLGNRLRRLRHQNGLTLEQAATNAHTGLSTWTNWERGRCAWLPWRSEVIAQAIGVPTGQLFTDELVLAEVRVVDETLAECRSEGREASVRAAQRIASQLEPLIWQAATQPPVDVSPGARAAKKRRTRAETLAGVKAANRAILRRREELSRRVV